MATLKSVLIAGGAGFIGSHLSDMLLARGYDVTIMDNLVTGRKQNIEGALAKGAKFIQHDITRPLPSLPTRFSEIYNLASPASPVDFSKMPLFILETASRGHRHLLDLARADRARILFASTSEVYGDPEVHPQVESYFGNVNPVGPRGCYDEAKRFGEALTVAYQREFGTESRIVRIFNTYGERMRPNDGRIIPNFFIQALQGQSLSVYGDGKQTRSFCYVTDLCEGIFRLMQSSESRPVNIGNPIELTILDIATEINKLTGNSRELNFLPLPENDPKQRRPDISRAEEILDWKPQVDLAEGLRRTLEFFKRELLACPEGIVTPVMSC